jgi:hypothetical protein
MTADHPFPAAVTFPAASMGAAEDLWLLQRYEPVLRFTRGELFLPMPVEAYLEACGLWRPSAPGGAAGRRGPAEQICAPGELTPERLAHAGVAPAARECWLRFVERPLRRKAQRAWRRDPGRPRAAIGGRFAAVGLLGRLIDAVMRVSLLLRGRVPGGTVAAAEQRYRLRAGPSACPYYGRVTHDHGFVVLQYWFFYAMNDWRSTFGGVNDHEADWEQVTVFLPDPPAPAERPAWVACSSHDEVGCDLRRRHDDPELQWRDTHLVIFVGAGSHSGAYLPGDYAVTVEPPALGRLLAGLRRLSRLLLPWMRGSTGNALGIPFLDYHRGDGPGAGPGEHRGWQPVLVSDETPWVRDYRGLWGLDTQDPFGGERAPAGPRYERDGSVRRCWSDPVGWAGLDVEPPSRPAEQQAVEDRITEVDDQLAAVADELDVRVEELRRAHAGARALRDAFAPGARAGATALEASVEQARARRRALAAEREALVHARTHGLPQVDPHAHLRHRALPNAHSPRGRKRVLRAWSAFSTSFLLAGLAIIVFGHAAALLPALGGLTVLMLGAEAFARGHLLQFLAGLLAAAAVVALAWAAILVTISNWRWVVGGLLILAALSLLFANVRGFLLKR